MSTLPLKIAAIARRYSRPCITGTTHNDFSYGAGPLAIGRASTRSGSSGASALGNLREGTQRSVDSVGVRKQDGQLWGNHDDVGTRSEPLGVFSVDQRDKIRAFVFGTKFVRSGRFSFPHRAFFLRASQGEQ
jgi:hypothetical protein